MATSVTTPTSVTAPSSPFTMEYYPLPSIHGPKYLYINPYITVNLSSSSPDFLSSQASPSPPTSPPLSSPIEPPTPPYQPPSPPLSSPPSSYLLYQSPPPPTPPIETSPSSEPSTSPLPLNSKHPPPAERKSKIQLPPPFLPNVLLVHVHTHPNPNFPPCLLLPLPFPSLQQQLTTSTPISSFPALTTPLCLKICYSELILRNFFQRATIPWSEEPPGGDAKDHQVINVNTVTLVELMANVLSKRAPNKIQLDFSIPAEIGNAALLPSFALSNNRIIGEIPAVELLNSTLLTALDLGNNGLNESIPGQLTFLPQLKCIILPYTNVSGKIPPKQSKYLQRVLGIPDSSYAEQHGVYFWSDIVTNVFGDNRYQVGLVVLSLSPNFVSGNFFWDLIFGQATMDLCGVSFKRGPNCSLSSYLICGDEHFYYATSLEKFDSSVIISCKEFGICLPLLGVLDGVFSAALQEALPGDNVGLSSKNIAVMDRKRGYVTSDSKDEPAKDATDFISQFAVFLTKIDRCSGKELEKEPKLLKSKNDRVVDMLDSTIQAVDSKRMMLKTLYIVVRSLLSHLSNFQIHDWSGSLPKRYAFLVFVKIRGYRLTVFANAILKDGSPVLGHLPNPIVQHPLPEYDPLLLTHMSQELRGSYHLEDKVNSEGVGNDTPIDPAQVKPRLDPAHLPRAQLQSAQPQNLLPLIVTERYREGLKD